MEIKKIFTLPNTGIKFDKMIRAYREDFNLVGFSNFPCDVVLKKDKANVALIKIDGSNFDMIACGIQESFCATGVRKISGGKIKIESWDINFRGKYYPNGSPEYSMLSKVFI